MVKIDQLANMFCSPDTEISCAVNFTRDVESSKLGASNIYGFAVR